MRRGTPKFHSGGTYIAAEPTASVRPECQLTSPLSVRTTAGAAPLTAKPETRPLPTTTTAAAAAGGALKKENGVRQRERELRARGERISPRFDWEKNSRERERRERKKGRFRAEDFDSDIHV